MDSDTAYIPTLIERHQGLNRQNPSDAGFTWQVLATLPPFSASHRLANSGWGGGSGVLLVEEYSQSLGLGVDRCPEFLADLRDRAQQAGHLS